MTCMIVDDEDLARALLAKYIDQIDDLELVASCGSPLEAFNLLSKQAVDLLFLDIQMPEMKGTELMNALHPKPLVVFTTAYSEYAIESYDLEAVDYLLKPIRFERFLKAVQKARKLQPTIPSMTEDTLILKSGYDLHKVALEDILYIEGMKEYVAFHTPGRRIISLYSLKSLEKSLPSDRFLRVHRSYIVQKKHVKSLVNRQLKVGGKEVPVGESYLDKVREQIFT